MGEYENTDNFSQRMREVTVKQVDGKWVYFRSDGTILKVETNNQPTVKKNVRIERTPPSGFLNNFDFF